MNQTASPSQLSFRDRRLASRRVEDHRLPKRVIQLERELAAARSISEALVPPVKIGRLPQQIKVGDLVEKALVTALEVVGAEAGSVLLADSDSKQLIFHHSEGKCPVPRGTAIPWDKGIAGAVFVAGEPLIVPDVKLDCRYLSDIDRLTGYTTHELIAVPLKQWKGEPIGVIEVMNDKDHAGRLDEADLSILTIISALTAAAIGQAWLFEEAKLAEVVHRLGDISHDVKNMLMPVIAGADLMHEQIEVIDMLRSSSRRLEDRMREISDCVKGITTPPNFVPCQVADVVESVMKTLRLPAEEKGISLRTEGLDTLPSILADERRLYSAIYNLVNNAIPEVSPGGSITVRGRAEPEAGAIHLAIADSGRGMPPEVRDSLFTARTISRKAGGTGLGTKIVKDVVDAHGGQITVESTEGVGTTFFICLPIRQPSSS
jgi:signal transduction histidine kinase